MKKKYTNIFALLLLFCSLPLFNAKGQTDTLAPINIHRVDTVKGDFVQSGMRTEKAWRNTGAVTTISGEELARSTSGNLLNTLNGRLAGLTVITGSGEPGYDNPSFVIRGQTTWNSGINNMLVYLDGFEVDMGAISSLSAYEIESVTLLKDASSLSVYGFSGGGAILITTKRGLNIGKPVITFNARYGTQSAVELPSAVDGYDYTRLYNLARQNDGLPIKYANPELYKSTNDPIHPNVDWYKEVLKSSSPTQNYNISFRGGSQKARYFLVLDHYNFSGLYKNADEIDKDFGTNAIYKKYNIRGNIEAQLTRNFSIRSEISGKIEDRDTPAGFTASEMFGKLLNTPATAFPVKNPDGSWGTSSVYDFNPVELLKQGGVYNGHTRNLQTNFSFTQKLDMVVSGLSLNGGISFSNQYAGNYSKKFTVPTFELTKDANDNPILDASGNYVYIKHGQVASSISDGESNHWNRTAYQLSLNYEHNFGLSTVTGMLLAKKQQNSHNGLVYLVRSQGVSADVTYDYNKKYVLDLSVGYMGSADFSEGNRYGFFPAVGAGWIVSNEDFLKDNSFVNYLKLKTSYGSTGNVNENYRFLYEQWATNSGVPGWIVGDNNEVKTGWKEGTIGNPDFSWETKTSFNIGFESTLFRDLSVSLDVFKEKRTGIIEMPNAEVPYYTGFPIPYLNNGEVNNKGFELAMRYNGNVNHDFQYYIGATAAFARNEIKYMSEVAQPFPYLYNTGYRIGQARGLVSDGFYQTSDFDASGVLKEGVAKSTYSVVKPGDLKYKDQTNDGIINEYDRVPMKYSGIPEWTMGLNVGFKFKGFDFDAFFQGVTNRTVMMPEIYAAPFINNNNITPFSLNSWTPETASTATSPRLTTQLNLNNLQNSDFWMKDGSFIKLRSIELGYTIPQVGFFKKLDTIRIYLNGTNLFTWDKIDNLEAENLSSGYPLMKSVSLGLKVIF